MAYKDPPKEHQFKPGVVTNPGGAPRGKRISTALAHILDMTDEELAAFKKRKNLVRADHIALKWVEKLSKLPEKGGPQLLSEGLDRTEGKVKQVHEIEKGNPYAGMNLSELIVMLQRLKEAETPENGASGA